MPFWKRKRPQVTIRREALPDIPKLPKRKVAKEPKSHKVQGVVLDVQETLYNNTKSYSIWMKVDVRKKGVDRNSNFAFQIASNFAAAPLVKVGDYISLQYKNRGYIHVEKFGILLYKRDEGPNPDGSPPSASNTERNLRVVKPEEEVQEDSAQVTDEGFPLLRIGKA